MRRILTLVTTFLIAGQLFAQAPFAPNFTQNGTLNDITTDATTEKFKELRSKRAQTGDTRGSLTYYWVNFFDALENTISSPDLGSVLLFNDTTILISDAVSGDFYWFICGFMEVFDPTSNLLNDYYVEQLGSQLDVTFSEGKNFQVDSVAVYWAYERAPGVPATVSDTVRFYVFNNSIIDDGYVQTNFPSTGDMTDVPLTSYASGTFSPPASSIIHTEEVILTEADTTGGSVFVIPVSHVIGKTNHQMGVAAHFTSGQAYMTDDVLFSNDDLAPGDLNNFRVFTFEEELGVFPPSAFIDEGALNAGGVVFGDIFYQADTLGWNPYYYPTFITSDGWPYEHMLTDWYVAPIGAHFLGGSAADPCEWTFNDLSNVDGITNWLWDFDDSGAISFDQNPTYIYSENGSYDVTLEISSPSGSFSYERTIVVTGCGSGTGLDDLSSVVNFNLYPNPATEYVTIDIELLNAIDLELDILNSQGQVVYSEQLQNSLVYSNKVDVSDLAPGIYHARIQNGGAINLQRFVITE